MAVKRAVSLHQLLSTKFKTMELQGGLLELIGTPERTGAWLIYGPSGHGKTRFTLALAKELARITTVAYNTIEEGVKLSFQKSVAEVNLEPVSSNFLILDGDNLAQLKQRLKRHKSPNVIIIDSIQYLTSSVEKQRNITAIEYKELIKRYSSKLFIFISHADDAGNPKGSLAKAVLYDADVKIRVEGYKAFALSRYGGNTPYTIWEKGAQEYWNVRK